MTRRRAWRGGHGGGDTAGPTLLLPGRLSPLTPSQPQVRLLPGSAGRGQRWGADAISRLRPVRTASPIGLCFIQGGRGRDRLASAGTPWAGAREGTPAGSGAPAWTASLCCRRPTSAARVSLSAYATAEIRGCFKPPYALSRELHVLSFGALFLLVWMPSARLGKENKIGGSTGQRP